MFTGIIEAVGEVRSARSLEGGGRELSVSLPEDWHSGVSTGDSIAVSGVCLTVAGLTGSTAAFQAVKETVSRSTIASWQTGTKVNLERSLPADGRFGGHIVAGHVDAAGMVRSINDTGTGREVFFALPAELIPLVAEKGSIAVDGVSLTVARVEDDVFAVALIPETLARTTLGGLKPGGRVNLEADVIARYVKRAVETLGLPPGPIDMDFLKDHGFA